MSELKTLRCDCCGGEVEKLTDTNYKCLSCDMTSTIYSGELQTRLQIARDHRLSCQFDKAIKSYEDITKDYPFCGEAFFGLFISEYGIEYVSARGEAKPTCHRASAVSVFENTAYKAATSLCNNDEWKIKGQEIESLRNEILDKQEKENISNLDDLKKQLEVANANAEKLKQKTEEDQKATQSQIAQTRVSTPAPKPIPQPTNVSTPAPQKPFTKELDFTLLSNDTYEVEVGTYKNLAEIIIPSIYLGKAVTSIEEDAFSYCTDLTSIEIPNSVTSIGKGAFSWCNALTSIIIPNSIISIGKGAFSCCTALTSIEIPSGVTNIGEYAFCECKALTSIEVPNSVTSIGEGAFSYCTALTSINIPNSVTSIGESAFSFCDALTSINIPSSVTSIGEGAFTCCEKVVIEKDHPWFQSDEGVLFNKDKTLLLYCPPSKTGDFIIPNSVTCIGKDAFSWCDALTFINIPNSVTCIGKNAFDECSSLKKIFIQGNKKGIKMWDKKWKGKCSAKIKFIK